MTALITGGAAGLLLGMALQRCRFTDRRAMIHAVAARKPSLTRVFIFAMGLGTVLVAFLCWLAVIDVDLITVLPLHGGVLIGGAVFGAAMGLCGLTPGTALAAVGGGLFAEGLCGTAGCIAGGLLLPYLAPLFRKVQSLPPFSDRTLFQVTLDEPFLFPGRFLALGCVGAAMMLIALFIRPKALPVPQETPPQEEPSAPEEIPSTQAEEVQADTVVASLPQEEPVVVDTAPPGEDAPAPPADEEDHTG